VSTAPEHRSADRDEPGDTRLEWTLRIGACACFAGWAWQHLRWSVPYDAVLWNPDYMGWLSDRMGMSWETYVAEGMTDHRILLGVRCVGWIHLMLAALTLITGRASTVGVACLGFGGGLLGLLAGCKYVDAGHALATFVEHGGQVLSPVILILALRRGLHDRWTICVAVFAFCATFAGHGVYATGMAATPGHFYGMVSAILGLGERGSDVFLKLFGVFDFLACVGLLVPGWRRACLAYGAVWGALTAIARPIAGMSPAAPWWGADQFLHEAVLRAPHAAVPFYLWWRLGMKAPVESKEAPGVTPECRV
jgi:hypothetical protein